MLHEELSTVLPSKMTFLCHICHKLHCQCFAQAHDAIRRALDLSNQRLNQRVFNHESPSAPHNLTLLYQLLSNILRKSHEAHLQAYLR